jgi:hypothetical protein
MNPSSRPANLRQRYFTASAQLSFRIIRIFSSGPGLAAAPPLERQRYYITIVQLSFRL